MDKKIKDLLDKINYNSDNYKNLFIEDSVFKFIKVEAQGTFKNITTSLIGLLTIGVGSILIYRNSKKNNEMV